MKENDRSGRTVMSVGVGIPGSMWPPPYLKEATDKLINTVDFIHKFMIRSQKSSTKRILVGYFGLRDLRKFKKYERKLDSVASGFESPPNNVNINEVLLDIIKDRAQHPIDDEDSGEDDDSQHSEERTKPVRRKNRAADQEASAEPSRLRKGKAKQTEAEDTSSDEHLEKSKTGKKVSIQS